jgi:hypothetical protein
LKVNPGVFESMTDFPADASVMVARRREVNELIVLLSK